MENIQNENDTLEEEIDPNILKISKSICKIKIEIQSGIISSSGFFLKFYIEQELFYCIIFNNHEITDDMINNNNIIHLSYDNNLKSINFKLDKKKRYIKNFKDINLNINIIEIIEEDKISNDYFLYSEKENIIKSCLIGSQIYTTYYTKEKKLINIKSKIKEVIEYEFIHLLNTNESLDLSGYPILLENCTQVIGIMKETSIDKSKCLGDFIYPIINIIKEQIRKKRNNGKYVKGKYI